MRKYVLVLAAVLGVSNLAPAFTKSDGIVYDTASQPAPHYIIKSDGVIYDMLSGAPLIGPLPANAVVVVEAEGNRH